MGAWDAGPFDNDDAGDWAYDFEGADEATGTQLIAEALDLGDPGDEVEAFEGSAAVAAANVVAWMRDPDAIPDSPYGEDAATWVRTVRPTPDPALVTAALTALDRVRADGSELAEMWSESGDTAWRESLARIEAGLRS
jgi:hypothetical protein